MNHTEPSATATSTTDNPTQNPILQVDYSWRKWTASITEKSNPTQPLYTVHYRPFAISPHIIYKSTTTTPPTTIGTGTLHPFSINSHYTLTSHDKHHRGTLKALKRWKTSYTHLSPTHTDPTTGQLLPMTWTSDSDFKTWDFICLDPDKLPIAKFSANLWALKRIGVVEFMGPRRWERGIWDEVVVTGLTLLYCMVLRTSSLLSFFGAVFARPGPIERGDGDGKAIEGVQGGEEERDGGMGKGKRS